MSLKGKVGIQTNGSTLAFTRHPCKTQQVILQNREMPLLITDSSHRPTLCPHLFVQSNSCKHWANPNVVLETQEAEPER